MTKFADLAIEKMAAAGLQLAGSKKPLKQDAVLLAFCDPKIGEGPGLVHVVASGHELRHLGNDQAAIERLADERCKNAILVYRAHTEA